VVDFFYQKISMKKIIFFLALIGGLIFPVLAFAEVNFSGPTGEVWFPITFSATWEAGDIPENAVWVVPYFYTYECDEWELQPSDYISVSGLAGDWLWELSDMELWWNDEETWPDILACLEQGTDALTLLWWYDVHFSSLGPDPAEFPFSVLEKEIPPYNFIPVQLDFPAKILTYPKTLFSDIGDIIALIIGLPLAFWGIGKVITLAKF
jgi:hypothetical protein